MLSSGRLATQKPVSLDRPKAASGRRTGRAAQVLPSATEPSLYCARQEDRERFLRLFWPDDVRAARAVGFGAHEHGRSLFESHVGHKLGGQGGSKLAISTVRRYRDYK